MKNDKKSNKLITIEDIGKPKIVNFSIKEVELFEPKINQSVFYSISLNKNLSSILQSNRMDKVHMESMISLPSSKSETNRVLPVAVFMSNLFNRNIIINNVLNSEDTNLMLRALNLNCGATQSLKIVPSSDREFLNKSYFYSI